MIVPNICPQVIDDYLLLGMIEEMTFCSDCKISVCTRLKMIANLQKNKTFFNFLTIQPKFKTTTQKRHQAMDQATTKEFITDICNQLRLVLW